VQGNHRVYVTSDKVNKKENKNLAKFICWVNSEKGETQISSSMWIVQMRIQVI